ncbi:FGGY family carbohydrate kinase [Tropicimonas sp. IMCC6043]|uniref:FGGY family carbohydrate kinase n=1 Tax=Tropicimonas sp. IMCC6043 TaxID=2510645 RepID=UPI00101C7AC7|nr:FGGY-family carbohydrate kinase [Tropicimonas sp. IMCC6043]RYH08670.1 glycerol kinase [Tropicimonas sp. IMCC6043]
MQRAVLAIDEGTTNSKAILVAESGEIISRGSAPVPTVHPRPGWVQQEAAQIWQSTIAAIAACRAEAPGAEIVAIGLSNQRESILAWDRNTGAPLGPVVTWQRRRTAPACAALKAAGHEAAVVARTGLPLDPMFPATKVGWLLDHHCAGKAAESICVGAIDSWLIWNLSGGRVHACDVSNAARTQLYNISDGRWDETLCEIFGVPLAMLPDICDSAHIFARTSGVDGLPDGMPVASTISDSHGALFGHGAFEPGEEKVTFGTGSSVMATLPEFIAPPRGITTTIAWSLNGVPTYAFEGNIQVSASILPRTAELLGEEEVNALLDLAQTTERTLGVILVPGHVGLGSPHWNADARGLICGLSFGSGRAQVARAAAESIAFQVADVFEIVEQNARKGIGRRFVDGGPSRNPFLMGLVADFADHRLIVGESTETSAQGAAYLAGLATGIWPDLETIGALVGHGAEIAPTLDASTRAEARTAWTLAIARATLGTG